MAYDLDRQQLIGSGSAVQAATALSRSSAVAYRVWRSLSEERRLALVDEALSASANDDLIDGLPVAL